MRRRLYFLLPSVARAERVFNELLLARIGDRHVHVLAREGTDLKELPEATLLQTTDAIHGMIQGLVLGGATGTVMGLYLWMYPASGFAPDLGMVLALAMLGALMGTWASGMIAADVRNPQLKAMYRAVDSGEVLMMVDVPKERVTEIEELMRAHHPEAHARGQEPTIPAFP